MKHELNCSKANPAPLRYHVYREDHRGDFVRGGQAEMLPDAVQAFLRTAPLIDGGKVSLWDCADDGHRLLASVEWRNEKTSFGFTVRARENIFHDEATAATAREIREREALEESISRRLQMTA